MQCCKFWIHPRIKIIDCPKLFQDAVLILADTLQSCKFWKGHCMHVFQYELPRVCLIKTSAVLYPVVRNGGQPRPQLALVLCDDRAMIGQPRGVVSLWINRNINRHPSKFRLTICAMTGTSCITRGAGKCPRVGMGCGSLRSVGRVLTGHRWTDGHLLSDTVVDMFKLWIRN